MKQNNVIFKAEDLFIKDNFTGNIIIREDNNKDMFIYKIQDGILISITCTATLEMSKI